MLKIFKLTQQDYLLIFSVVMLFIISIFVLRSIAPFLFPNYYLYIFLSIVIFLIFLLIDFEIFSIFSKHLYFLSLFLLVLPLLLGEITRGAIRWIPIGPITLQPSEIVRAFLIIHFAKMSTENEINFKNFVRLLFFFAVPFFLILIQPSLGVAFLLAAGFLGTLLASNIKKIHFLGGLLAFLILLPFIWFLLLPYQKERILVFLKPFSDPLGAGYNSIQSMIAVGSGRIFGRGLGKGVQTQLLFLPERHTDFIFASISEELGFLGSFLVLSDLFIILYMMTDILKKAKNLIARAFVSGVLLSFFAQTLIHIGMNVGLFPITGIPLPFVSAGGSALLGSVISLALVINSRKGL